MSNRGRRSNRSRLTRTPYTLVSPCFASAASDSETFGRPSSSSFTVRYFGKNRLDGCVHGVALLFHESRCSLDNIEAFNEMTAGRLEIPLTFPLASVRRLIRFVLRLHEPHTLLTDVWRMSEFWTISENVACLLCWPRGDVAWEGWISALIL